MSPLPKVISPTDCIQLGNSSVRVSRLGIGGGSAFVRAADEASALVQTALKAGLRHFDTAPLYGGGRSEMMLGHALEGAPRHSITISTKVGREANGNDEYVFDYSAKAVRHSIQRSLELLKIDRIDMVFLHDIDPDMQGAAFDMRYEQAVGEAYSELASFRDAGVIGAIGVGLKDWDVALRIAQTVRLDAIMLAGGYTLLQHGALAELLPWCSANAVSVLLAAPFNTGILAVGAVEGARYYYQPAPLDIMDRTHKMEAICARHGVALPAAALQFPLHHSAVASVVVGHERPVEVARNMDLLSTPISSAFWSDLKDAGLLPAGAPTPH